MYKRHEPYKERKKKQFEAGRGRAVEELHNRVCGEIDSHGIRSAKEDSVAPQACAGNAAGGSICRKLKTDFRSARGIHTNRCGTNNGEALDEHCSTLSFRR